MTMTKPEILYELTQKVDIPSHGDAIINLEAALSLNKELSRYGRTLTIDAILRLATYTKEEMKEKLDEISEILDKNLGISDFASSHPFYPDFPEQVMSMEEGELYFNALIYYSFSQTDSKECTEIANKLRDALVGEATITREPLEYNKIKDDLKPLGLAQENELEKQLRNLIMGPNLSSFQLECLTDYAKQDKNWVRNILGTEQEGQIATIPSHETQAKVAMLAYDMKDEKSLQQILQKAEDVLRFTAVLSSKHVSIGVLPFQLEATLKVLESLDIHPKDEDISTKTVHGTRLNKDKDIEKVYIRLDDVDKETQKRVISELQMTAVNRRAIIPERQIRDYMDANLSFGIKNNKKLFKLSRSEQRMVKGLLENCKDLYFSIWQREDIWKKLMQRLDTNDEHFPRVKRAFDNMHKGEKVLENGEPIRPSAGKALDDIIREYRLNPDNKEEVEKNLVNYAGMYPGNFARNIMRIANEGIDAQFLGELIKATQKNIPVFQQLKTANFIEKSEDWDYKIAKSKSGKTVLLKNTAEVSTEDRKVLADSVRETVLPQLKMDSPLKTIYIDEELKNRTLPLRDNRDASDGATLTKFSTINGKADKNIAAFGIFWRNEGKDRADIDLSVKAYSKDGEHLGEIYYGHLRNAWGAHSGDYTSGVISEEINGAEEFVFVDKTILKEMGAQYIIPFVHGFNRPFNEADSVRFMFMEKDGDLDMVENLRDLNPDDIYDDVPLIPPCFNGEIVNPSEIEVSYRLTQNSNMATPFIDDVEKDAYIWLDSVENIRGIPNIQNLEAGAKTAMTFYQAYHNDYPSMYEYAVAFARANNMTVVTEKQDAEIICSTTVVSRGELSAELTANSFRLI